MGRVESNVVPPLAGSERQGVYKPDDAGLGLERSCDHQRAFLIVAAGAKGAGGGYRPVPRIDVEESAEDRRRVIPRKTEPVDGSSSRDKGGRIAVGQQSVGGNGLLRRHATSSAAPIWSG